MDFDKEHKVIIETMNKAEAKAFLGFLDEEKMRHVEALAQAMDRVEDIEYDIACQIFWETASQRHQGDIDDIAKVTAQVLERFGL